MNDIIYIYKFTPLNANWDLEEKHNVLIVRIDNMQFKFKCGENINDEKAIQLFERNKKDFLLKYIETLQNESWWELDD